MGMYAIFLASTVIAKKPLVGIAITKGSVNGPLEPDTGIMVRSHCPTPTQTPIQTPTQTRIGSIGFNSNLYLLKGLFCGVMLVCTSETAVDPVLREYPMTRLQLMRGGT